MHEHYFRRVPDEVIVKRGNFKPVVERRAHHRTYLVFGQHQIAHDHVVFAVTLERRPRRETHRRGHFHTRDDHGEIFAGNGYLEYAFLFVKRALCPGEALNGPGVERGLSKPVRAMAGTLP